MRLHQRRHEDVWKGDMLLDQVSSVEAIDAIDELMAQAAVRNAEPGRS